MPTPTELMSEFERTVLANPWIRGVDPCSCAGHTEILAAFDRKQFTCHRCDKKYPRIPTRMQAKWLLTAMNVDEGEISETLYGGAAGGGKSGGALMGALQYVDTPGYHSLITRREMPMLVKSGGLIQLSREWLAGTGAAWNEQKHCWTFPSGATITFGHLEHEKDKYNYQGSAFSHWSPDEAQQLSESQYSYVWSRVRKPLSVPVPLRVMPTANPGGEAWVKTKFVNDKTRDPRTKFLRAKLADNPFLDREAYIAALGRLDAVTLAQLLDGDWDIAEGGKFRLEFFRWFTFHDRRYRIEPLGELPSFLDQDEGTRFVVADTAGGIKTDSDFTAIGCVEIPRLRREIVIVRDFVVERIDIDLIPHRIEAFAKKHDAARIYVECAGPSGLATYRSLQKRGLAVMPLHPAGAAKDSLVRVGPLLDFMRTGRVFYPRDAEWLGEVRSQLLQFGCEAWTQGRIHDDAVDVLAYAIRKVSDVVGPMTASGGSVTREQSVQLTKRPAMIAVHPRHAAKYKTR